MTVLKGLPANQPQTLIAMQCRRTYKTPFLLLLQRFSVWYLGQFLFQVSIEIPKQYKKLIELEMIRWQTLTWQNLYQKKKKNKKTKAMCVWERENCTQLPNAGKENSVICLKI